MNQFPFGVIFQVKDSELRIIAVANLDQKLDFIAKRDLKRTLTINMGSVPNFPGRRQKG